MSLCLDVKPESTLGWTVQTRGCVVWSEGLIGMPHVLIRVLEEARGSLRKDHIGSRFPVGGRPEGRCRAAWNHDGGLLTAFGFKFLVSWHPLQLLPTEWFVVSCISTWRRLRSPLRVLRASNLSSLAWPRPTGQHLAHGHPDSPYHASFSQSALHIPLPRGPQTSSPNPGSAPTWEFNQSTQSWRVPAVFLPVWHKIDKWYAFVIEFMVNKICNINNIPPCLLFKTISFFFFHF